MNGSDSAEWGIRGIDTEGLCLLALDGGGVRGLSSLYLLKAVMDRLNRARRNGGHPSLKPCELFDLIGGTSTGGIIAIMLGRLEMNVDECIQAYCNLMGTVFGHKRHSLPVNMSGQIKPRFDSIRLKAAIEEVITKRGRNPSDPFNDGAQRGCKVFVCAATRELYGIEHLRSYSLDDELDTPATICEAALATSAATGFFDPVSIGGRHFADGAIGANSPVDEVEREASNIWCGNTGNLKPLVKCFISIGTGNLGKEALEDNAYKFLSKSLRQIATETEETTGKFIARWRQHYEQKRYFRFNVEQGLQNVGLAEHSERATIETATYSYIAHQAQKFQMRDCVQNLQQKQKKMTITTLEAKFQDLNPKHVKFLRSLSTAQYEDHKDRNPKRVPGTCEWFTNHEHFRGWREKNFGLLWVTADPGCGKSVLVRYLVEEILSSTRTSTTCYFFFKDDFEDQKTVQGALRCLLRQLFRQRPDLISDEILRKFDEEGTEAFSSFRSLWSLLMNATRNYGVGGITFVLDALDECEEDGQRQLLRALNDIYGIEPAECNLKFLLTSRPYIHIQRAFQQLNKRDTTFHLSGESESEVEKLTAEIDIVIKMRVESLAIDLQLQPNERQLLWDELTAVKHRTYLWIHLVVDSIYKDCVGLTENKLRASIRTLPKTVNDAYEKILSSSRNEKEARKLLHFVVAACKPLTLQEMATAIAVEEHHHSRGELDIEPEHRLHDWIRAICGLFVVVINSRVYLLHQTAREFLVRPSGSKISVGSKWQYSFWLPDSHGIISSICMCYLQFPDRETSSPDGLISDPFFMYSARWWATHVRQSGPSNTSHQLSSVLQLCKVSGHWFWAHCKGWLRPYPTNPSPLALASMLGSNQAVQQFLKEGMEPGSDDSSAILWAIEFRHPSTVDVLLKGQRRLHKTCKGSRLIDLKDGVSRTPLHYATWNSDRATTQLLLDNGANVDAKDNFGWTSLFGAAHWGQEDIVTLLLKKGAKIDARIYTGETALFPAVILGGEAIVKLLLQNGANIMAKDNDGSTPLMEAARHGHESIVELLLENGAKVNTRDNNNSTPIIAAAGGGHEAVVKLLLQKGATVDEKNTDGCTPLLVAALGGHETVIKLLLEKGAEVDVKNVEGKTPLLVAACGGHGPIGLVDRGTIRVDVVSSKGQMSRFKADRRFENSVKLLLERGAKVNVRSLEGKTPLSEANYYDQEAIVELLKKYQGPPTFRSAYSYYSALKHRDRLIAGLLHKLEHKRQGTPATVLKQVHNARRSSYHASLNDKPNLQAAPLYLDATGTAAGIPAEFVHFRGRRYFKRWR